MYFEMAYNLRQSKSDKELKTRTNVGEVFFCSFKVSKQQ